MSYQPVEEPSYKPSCCGQQSKWVCHSPTLTYFYCEVCKKEVDPKAESSTAPDPYGNWDYGTSDLAKSTSFTDVADPTLSKSNSGKEVGGTRTVTSGGPGAAATPSKPKDPSFVVGDVIVRNDSTEEYWVTGVDYAKREYAAQALHDGRRGNLPFNFEHLWSRKRSITASFKPAPSTSFTPLVQPQLDSYGNPIPTTSFKVGDHIRYLGIVGEVTAVRPHDKYDVGFDNNCWGYSNVPGSQLSAY